MAANVDFLERIKIIGARILSGRDTYAGRQDAWHLMGDVSGTFRTLAEILAAARADFPVVKFQLDFQGAPVDAWATFRVDLAIPKGLEARPVRKVTLADGREYFLNFLAPAGKDYQVIQQSSFDLLDHLVGQIDGAHYETAGVLDFGRTVWAQIDPKFSISVGDDKSVIYLTASTSHDGSSSFSLTETATRIQCRNTWKIARLNRLAAKLTVRHTKNADVRIGDLKAEIEDIRNVAMSMQDKLTWLSQRRATKESFTTIFDRLFPKTKNDDGVESSSTRRDGILADILARYEDNDGDAFPEQRGTLYNAFNAITEFVDHGRGSKENGRAESAVFGSGDRLKTSALDLILAEAEGAPLMRSAQTGVLVDWVDAGLNVPGVKTN